MRIGQLEVAGGPGEQVASRRRIDTPATGGAGRDVGELQGVGRHGERPARRPGTLELRSRSRGDGAALELDVLGIVDQLHLHVETSGAARQAEARGDLDAVLAGTHDVGGQRHQLPCVGVGRGRRLRRDRNGHGRGRGHAGHCDRADNGKRQRLLVEISHENQLLVDMENFQVN